MIHSYKPNDGSACLSSRRLLFIGDSVTRKLFYQLAHILDPTLPNAPPDDEHKHADYILHSKSATQISFYWDPFLNSSRTHNIITTPYDATSKDIYAMRRPALLVLGSGLWYLRYADSSGGISAWEANIESVLHSIAHSRSKPADNVVLLPVEEIVTSKLSPERAMSMRASDIDAMNSDLFHRVNPPSGDYLHFFSSSSPSMPVALPLVFNQMLDPSQTEDGLHFSNAVVKIQANILLNLRCNDALPKRFPLDKTCCRKYPWPSALQFIILGLSILWGPCTWVLSRQSGTSSHVLPLRCQAKTYVWYGTIGVPLMREEQIHALTFSAAIALIFMADRTGFWLKEQKQFHPWTFTFLGLFFLAIGLATVKRKDKDLGFLNRQQTDEWKGWMQSLSLFLLLLIQLKLTMSEQLQFSFIITSAPPKYQGSIIRYVSLWRRICL